jgi:hypothetical protein
MGGRSGLNKQGWHLAMCWSLSKVSVGDSTVALVLSPLGRVWAAPGPQMLKASHEHSKLFAQLVATIQYGSKLLETLRSDLSRR